MNSEEAKRLQAQKQQLAEIRTRRGKDFGKFPRAPRLGELAPFGQPEPEPSGEVERVPERSAKSE